MGTCLEKIIGRHTIPKEEIVPSNTERPVIFAITHIGKYDIEMANEAIIEIIKKKFKTARFP